MSEELYNVLMFRDVNGKVKSIPMENEEHVILNNKILLNYVPDRNNKVIINGMYEVKQGQRIAENTQFKVDYSNGEVTFHADKNNSTIVINKYFGIGIIKVYASRVIDNKGESVDTSKSLQDYIDSVKPYGYKGEYNPSDPYEANSIISYDYGIYRCKQKSNGITPTNADYWELMVSVKNEASYAKTQGDYAKSSADGILFTSEDFTPETITINNDIAPLVKNELDRIDSQLAEKAEQSDLNNISLHLDNVQQQPKSLNPIFIEQFFTTWQGRGQLTSEIPYENTTQRTSFVTSYAKGISDITVVNASNIQLGQMVAIEHTDLTHGTYFVYAKTGNQLTIIPGLRAAVDSNSHLERAWANYAHQSEYAGKYIAEQLANATYDDYANGELLYEMTFDTINTDVKVMGGATLGTNEATDKPYGLYYSPQTALYGTGQYVITAGNYTGLRMADFKVRPNSRVSIRGYFYANQTSGIIALVTKDGTELISKSLPYGAPMTRQVYNVDIPKNVDTVHIEIRQFANTPVTIYMDEIHVVEVGEARGYIIPRSSKVVLLFDSWGAFSNSAIPSQLQNLLPQATIIDKGVAGNAMWNMLDRFDTDIAPLKPNVVICNGAVNDIFNYMADDVAFETYFKARQMLIDKCKSIGALPVFLGAPALNESDTFGHSNFELNIKARKTSVESARRLLPLSSLNRKTKQYDFCINIDNLPAYNTKYMILGIVPNGATATIKAAGGYGMSATNKIFVGFITGYGADLIGNENNSNIYATNFYSKSNGNLETDINFTIKNNDGVSRLLAIMVNNANATPFTGNAFVSLEY